MEKLIKKFKEISQSKDWIKTASDIETIVQPLDDYFPIEYNTDTSVRHSKTSDNIVRPTSNKEDVELQNKESVR